MTTATEKNAREAFEFLQAQHAAVYQAYNDEWYAQRRKYGETAYLTCATKTEREKLDRLHRKIDKLTDRMIRLLSALSPDTDWRTGIGITTMFTRLTFEQACDGIKP